MARLVKRVKASFPLAGRIDGRIFRRDDLLHRVGRSDVRVAPAVMILQNLMPERPGIHLAEPITPVVRVAPELRRPALRIHLAGVRSEAKIAAANGVFLAVDM